jgi:hypothetical protein
MASRSLEPSSSAPRRHCPLTSAYPAAGGQCPIRTGAQVGLGAKALSTGIPADSWKNGTHSIKAKIPASHIPTSVDVLADQDTKEGAAGHFQPQLCSLCAHTPCLHGMLPKAWDGLDNGMIPVAALRFC